MRRPIGDACYPHASTSLNSRKESHVITMSCDCASLKAGRENAVMNRTAGHKAFM